MKYLLFLTIIFSFISCEENVESWDSLDAQERANIRNRGALKCASNSESGIKTHAKNARDKMVAMKAKQYWKIETGEGSSKDTSYLIVWKRTGEKVFFIYRDKDERVSFIKMTPAFNELMLRDLMQQYCAESTTDNVVVTTGSTAASILIKDRSFSSPPDYYKLDTTFKTESKYPIFFLRYLFEQKKKKLKESGSTTVTETKTITAKVASTADDFDLPDSYTDFSSPQFCIPKYTTEGTDKIDMTPHQIEGLELICTTSAAGPANPDAATFPDMNFVPTTEL